MAATPGRHRPSGTTTRLPDDSRHISRRFTAAIGTAPALVASILGQATVVAWATLVLSALWLAHFVIHSVAGYWHAPNIAQRWAMRRWMIAELLVAAALLTIDHFVWTSRSLHLWIALALAGCAAAINIIADHEGRLVATAGLKTGCTVMRRAVSWVFHDENTSAMARSFRWLNSRSEGSVSSNFSVLACSAIAALAFVSGVVAVVPAPWRTAVIEMFTGSPTHYPDGNAPTDPAKPPDPAASVPRFAPFIDTPAPIKPRQTSTGPRLPYSKLCERSQGGPVPGAGGQSWAAADIGALILGTGVGVGGYVSGCLDIVRTIRDDTAAAITAWAPGYLDGQLLSVALTSTDLGRCLILGSAAVSALALLRAGTRIACEGRHDHFGDVGGDAYLLETRSGVYAFARCTQYADADKPQPYIEMSPLVSDAWVRAQQSVGHSLIPVSQGSGRWAMVDCAGNDSGITITIEAQSVAYRDDSRTFVLTTAQSFDWSVIP